MIRQRLRIGGRVQGVGYRAWLSREAAALGVRGWVRNRADGSVEATAQGDAGAVAALVARTRAGPPAARVDRVDVADEAVDTALAGFTRRPTA